MERKINVSVGQENESSIQLFNNFTFLNLQFTHQKLQFTGFLLNGRIVRTYICSDNSISTN